MNRKLFRVITVVLAVLIVGQLLNLALQIHSDIYHYSYDEDTFLYTIQDGRYSELPDKKRRNEMEHVKADAQLQECYAVAKDSEGASIPFLLPYNAEKKLLRLKLPPWQRGSGRPIPE